MVLDKVNIIEKIKCLSKGLNPFDENDLIKKELIRLEEDLKYIKNYFKINYSVSTDTEETEAYKYISFSSNNEESEDYIKAEKSLMDSFYKAFPKEDKESYNG